MDLNRLQRSGGYHALVAGGLASYGLVHLITAVLALQVAIGQTVTVSSGGALRDIAGRPLGSLLIWSMCVGLLAASFWQVTEATVGRSVHTATWTRRLASLGRAATYLTLGLLALGTAINADEPQRQHDTATAQLMSTTAGPVLIDGLGLAVVAVGVGQIYRGIRQKFREDLTRSRRPTVVLGAVGFSAKGLVLVLVGALLVAAGVTHDADDVGGMDAALVRLRAQQFGPVLLAIISGGLGCFGLYCLVWAARARV